MWMPAHRSHAVNPEKRACLRSATAKVRPTIAIQLEPANAANGQLLVLAGSHHCAKHWLVWGDEGDLPVVALETQPGDPVQPSARPVPLETDVKIVLIHGDGHGGGHGGSHGHWRGHSGGWSRHRHLRGWGHLYSPFYGSPCGAYGYYGPGGWAYPPYWGPYAPCWYGAYPGYGAPSMNQVVIGTAIRYTDL